MRLRIFVLAVLIGVGLLGLGGAAPGLDVTGDASAICVHVHDPTGTTPDCIPLCPPGPWYCPM